MKNKEKEQKNIPTFIKIDLTDAPQISDGDCSHFKIKNEGKVPANGTFFCLSMQLEENCCRNCLLDCNPLYGM